MKAGLLICDHVREELAHIGGQYHDMFKRLLPKLELTPYCVCDDEFPASPDSEEVYLSTGSSFSVYEEIPWILKLNDFIRQVYNSNIPFAGVCFGHQMIAQALGGKVQKAGQGWNIGVHEFQVTDQADWMTPPKSNLNVVMMCQDQVIELPPNSKVLAKAPQCPVGMYTVGTHFLGIQGHPEYSKEFDQALYHLRSGRIPKGVIDAADQSMNRDPDTKLLASWITAFLEMAVEKVS